MMKTLDSRTRNRKTARPARYEQDAQGRKRRTAVNFVLTMALAVAVPWVTGCQSEAGSSNGVTDTRTNWLMQCDADTDCGSDLSCLCGLCTNTCEDDDDCSQLSRDAVCRRHTQGCAGFEMLCLSPVPAAESDGDEEGPGPGSTTGDAGRSSSALAAGEGMDGAAPRPSADDAAPEPRPDGAAPQPAQPSDASVSSMPEASVPVDSGPPRFPDAGPASSADPDGGLPLGGTCYDDAISDEAQACREGYCDTPICTDAIPSHCTSTCVCSGPGIQCRTVTDGEVTHDRPCCDGYSCELSGGSSSGNTEVYYCQEDTEAMCESDCAVGVQQTDCAAPSGFNVVWMCESPPPEVTAGCIDMATALARWCCPETVLPQCVPEP